MCRRLARNLIGSAAAGEVSAGWGGIVPHAGWICSGAIAGIEATGIQITTAAGICTVLDLLADGSITKRGFVRQEDITLEAFLTNRFGRAYSAPAARTDLAA